MLTTRIWPTLLLLSTLAPNPQAQTPPQLSPKAAYADAMHPLDVTRNNIGNWSDVEIAAMNVAIARGKDACLARNPSTYTGADLVDLARLCSLGQQWPVVVDAATRYITEPATPKPLLADAYIGKIHAELRLKSEQAALTDSLTLLKSVPYTAEVADSLDETLGYMRYLLTANALTLAAAREPLILQALATPQTADPKPDSPQLSPHQLYAQGLAYAALQQLAARPREASATIAALDAALPKPLPPDESIPIAEARRRYDLLGHRLSDLQPTSTLQQGFHARIPALPAHLTITALLLFPDWCAQCVRLGPQLPETVFSVEGHSAYLFGLLAQTVPSRKPDPSIPNLLYNPAYAASMLAGTPTLTVSPALLDRFGGSEYPLLLLTDANGILRVIEPVTADDLRPGGDLDAAIALVGKTFPPHPPGADTRPSPAPSQAHR